MNVGLFIPCYINQFYPHVGIAALELLEKQGISVVYPRTQTCCGQPTANSGFEAESRGIYKLFVNNFQSVDYIVSPSGSCVHHVRDHYDTIEQTGNVEHIRKNTYEVCEFLVKILGKDNCNAEFPYRVGLHQSCHGLRGLRLGASSELQIDPFSYPSQLLKNVKGIQLVDLHRSDECCGFGGTFAITEEAVSIKMGVDRIHDHLLHHAEVITATDMSCLMHLEGIIKRRKLPIQVKHIVEILNSTVQ
ncbi:MAG: (Fe-S)-binding protein [Bacteroidota bacterium]